jgi:hypothetical protein
MYQHYQIFSPIVLTSLLLAGNIKSCMQTLIPFCFITFQLPLVLPHKFSVFKTIELAKKSDTKPKHRGNGATPFPSKLSFAITKNSKTTKCPNLNKLSICLHVKSLYGLHVPLTQRKVKNLPKITSRNQERIFHDFQHKLEF